VPDEAISHKPAMWLIDEYERVARARWDAMLEQVSATQLGVGRALAQAFGEKHLPDLPTYESTLGVGHSDGQELPGWMRKFEEVNEGRREAK